MKPAKTNRVAQDEAANDRIDAAIDRILAVEEELIPTSGFLASVMERVEEEAAAPAPIPFPWKRFIPGMVLATVVFGWSAVELVRLGLSARDSLTLPVLQLSTAGLRSLESAGWAALALFASLISWLVARRLAGRGGLL